MAVRVSLGPDAGTVAVLLFLSYADEDQEIAQEIIDRLSSEDVNVYAPQESVGHSDLTAPEPEYAIQKADAFLALISPNSLTSTSCRRDRELALCREQCRRDNGGPTDFVQMLQIRETPYHQAGSLHSRPWFDLTSQAVKEQVLSDLASKFKPPADPPPPHSHPPAPGNGGRAAPPSQPFRNRERELEEIYIAASRQDDEHFWLVIAPPQLGKSWFLNEIGEKIDQSWRGRWVIKLVDARELSTETVRDAEAILRMMFGLAPDARTARPIAESIATSISGNDRYHLCLLDSAELLDDSTVRTLRQYLSEIYRRVVVARANSRLALVVASRRDSEWKGVTPTPRIHIRELSEFKVEVIQDALEKLAREMRHPFTELEMEQLARRVHRLSEGLPALLAGCLNWIQERGWTGLDQLEDQDTFEDLARPYIERDLLSPRSLRGFGSMPTLEERAAIQRALRALSPYRLLTASHLSRYTQHGDLHDAIDRLRWSVEDLWAAVSGTDLLYRPQKEPWHAIYDPIRRLLFRHWYPADESRIQAHRNACDFLQSFLIGQSGNDQCRVLVECLWHQVQILVLGRSDDLEITLIRFAGELAARLTPNPHFDRPTLRGNAAWCMTDDYELADAVSSVPGLFDRMVETVRQP